MSADLESRLDEQIQNIEEAIQSTRQNKLADLSHMDKTVAGICNAVMTANEDTAQSLEPKMIRMINLLDELAVELKEFQDRQSGGSDT